MTFVQPSNVSVDDPVKASDENAQNDAISNLNARASGMESSIMAGGSFESDSDADGTPDNWTLTTYVDATTDIDSGARGDGLKSLKCSITASGGYVEAENNSEIAIYPGARIEVPFFFKTSVATVRVRVQIEWLDSTKTPTSTSTVFDSASGNPSSWTLRNGYNVQAVCPSGSYWYKIKLIAGESGNSVAGNIWFDSIRPRLYHGLVLVDRISKTKGTVDISGDVVPGEKGLIAVLGLELTSGTTTISTMTSTGNGKASMSLTTAPGGTTDDENTPKYLEWKIELNDSMQCTVNITLGTGATPGAYTLYLLGYYV